MITAAPADAPVLAPGHEISYGRLMRSILNIAPVGQRFWYRWYLPAA
jgi:hypothetical protein